MADDFKSQELMDKIVSLCKRRGFIFPSSEIYGGFNGFWDYGPYGCRLKRAVEALWWREMVETRDNIEGLDSTIGPTSSITGITIAQALVCQVVDNLVKAGLEPPVFKSSNVDGGDTHNNRMFDTYYGYWK